MLRLAAVNVVNIRRNAGRDDPRAVRVEAAADDID
jgi:hypothetical protein